MASKPRQSVDNVHRFPLDHGNRCQNTDCSRQQPEHFQPEDHSSQTDGMCDLGGLSLGHSSVSWTEAQAHTEISQAAYASSPKEEKAFAFLVSFRRPEYKIITQLNRPFRLTIQNFRFDPRHSPGEAQGKT